MSLSKHNEKMKLMRISFLLRNVLLEMISKIFLYTHKKHNFLWKSVPFFWFDLSNVLSILQKLKVAINSITILGYSNNKKYIYCKEYYFDWPVDSPHTSQDLAYSAYEIRPMTSRRAFRKAKYLKLTLKEVKLQWHKCWRKKEERW